MSQFWDYSLVLWELKNYFDVSSKSSYFYLFVIMYKDDQLSLIRPHFLQMRKMGFGTFHFFEYRIIQLNFKTLIYNRIFF